MREDRLPRPAIPRRRPAALAMCLTLFATTPAAAQPAAEEAAPEEAAPEATPAPAPDPTLIGSSSERADELHLEARELMDAAKWEEAVILLEEAHRLKQSYDISTNLGAVLLALDRHREAATLLSRAVSELPTVIDPAAKEKILSFLQQAREQVASARIRAVDDGATILVDGEPVGTSPLELEIYLDPGEHRFEAEKSGAKSEPVIRDMEKGKETAIDLGPIQVGLIDPPNGDGPGSVTIAGAVIAGVGGAALIAGGVLFGISAGKRSDLEDRASGLRAGTDCDSPAADPSGLCVGLADDFASAQTMNNAGIPMMAVGGGLALVGLVLIIVDQTGDAPPDTAYEPRLDVWAGAGAGANLTVPF